MDEHKDATASQQQAPAQAPPPAPPPVDPPQPPPNPDSEKDDGSKKMSKSEKIMVWATCVIAAGTIVSAVAIALQWREMVKGGADTSALVGYTQRQADDANQIAAASQRNATAAEGFATSASGINTKLDQAVDKLNTQAEATNNLARQAQIAAETASKQLAVAQAQFETSQRPWISIVSIDPVRVQYNADYFPFPASKPIKSLGVETIVMYKNTGNLPATDVTVGERLYFANWKLGSSGVSITDEAKRKQKELCMSGDTHYPESMRFRVNPGSPEQTDMGEGALLDNPEYEIPGGLQVGAITPVVVGCVFYRYSSSFTVHHTGFIFYVLQKNSAGVSEYMHPGVDPGLGNVAIQDLSNVAFSD